MLRVGTACVGPKRRWGICENPRDIRVPILYMIKRLTLTTSQLTSRPPHLTPYSLTPSNQRRTPIVPLQGIALQGYAPSLFTPQLPAPACATRLLYRPNPPPLVHCPDPTTPTNRQPSAMAASWPSPPPSTRGDFIRRSTASASAVAPTAPPRGAAAAPPLPPPSAPHRPGAPRARAVRESKVRGESLLRTAGIHLEDRLLLLRF